MLAPAEAGSTDGRVSNCRWHTTSSVGTSLAQEKSLGHTAARLPLLGSPRRRPPPPPSRLLLDSSLDLAP